MSSNYSVINIADVENSFAKRGWPGEMKFLKKPGEFEQIAITYRKMPKRSGGKGGYGHRHRTQEEIIYVMKGEIEVKLDDQVITAPAGTVVRIAPPVVRSIDNEQDEEAEILIISTKIDESMDKETKHVENFWPED